MAYCGRLTPFYSSLNPNSLFTISRRSTIFISRSNIKPIRSSDLNRTKLICVLIRLRFLIASTPSHRIVLKEHLHRMVDIFKASKFKPSTASIVQVFTDSVQGRLINVVR
ncbi:hypothetical protein L1987_50123 [Smallanthus sonchifolius]|uniref:Uncharacterized protein n=1 Tax=Smallanthus sonchifolius TaxID=185202 RepID=A0ACB9FWD3_9ASTR|nr:hypothetical protein L1987_50123 [Smallanthus sonchifolius]